MKSYTTKSQAKRAHLLSILLAFAIIASVPCLTYAQSGLHVVSSPFINNSTLYGAAAIVDNDIWAVGVILGSKASNNATLAEHFDGNSWSVIPTPAVAGGQFAAVDGVASNDVWAVGTQAAGNSGTTLIEHWNGTSWSVVSSPNVGHGTFFTTVTAISSSDVWAAGSNNSLVLMEHWNGVNWNVVSSPAFTGVGTIYGISADSSNDVWAVTATSNTVLHWNGQSWSQVPAPSAMRGDAVTVLSPTNVWVAGSRSGEHPDSLAEIWHWDGSSWSLSPTVNPLPNNVSSRFDGIAAVSASNIWAIGSFSEHWNGTSWSLVNTPSGVGILGITALSDGTVVAVGGSCNPSCSAVILEN